MITRQACLVYPTVMNKFNLVLVTLSLFVVLTSCTTYNSGHVDELSTTEKLIRKLEPGDVVVLNTNEVPIRSLEFEVIEVGSAGIRGKDVFVKYEDIFSITAVPLTVKEAA